MKKTGIELIAEERQEQIDKHGFSMLHDEQHDESQLIMAALCAIPYNPDARIARGLLLQNDGWDRFLLKIESKSNIGKLVIAGALLSAEIDRLQALKDNFLK